MIEMKSNVIYHYLSNDHYFIQFRFKLIKYDDSDSKATTSLIYYVMCLEAKFDDYLVWSEIKIK
jgi:hypothetical protein